MRTRSAISLGILTLLAAISLKAKPFSITTSGEIPLNIALLREDLAESPVTLTLVHRLLNVGSKYVSNVCIAELESRLVEEENDRYSWISPSGRSYKARLGEVFSDGGRRWVINKAHDGLVVHSGQHHFVYRKGVLIEARNGSTAVSYHFANEHLNEVCCGRRSLEIKSADSGYIIKSGDNRISVTLNEWDSILTCTLQTPSGEKAYKFQYADALLAQITDGGDSTPVAMGYCEWSGDFTRNRVFHPVATSIGSVRIKIKRNAYTIEGAAYGHGKIIAFWKSTRTGGKFKVTNAGGSIDMLLADVDAYVIND